MRLSSFSNRLPAFSCSVVRPAPFCLSATYPTIAILDFRLIVRFMAQPRASITAEQAAQDKALNEDLSNLTKKVSICPVEVTLGGRV